MDEHRAKLWAKRVVEGKGFFYSLSPQIYKDGLDKYPKDVETWAWDAFGKQVEDLRHINPHALECIDHFLTDNANKPYVPEKGQAARMKHRAQLVEEGKTKFTQLSSPKYLKRLKESLRAPLPKDYATWAKEAHISTDEIDSKTVDAIDVFLKVNVGKTYKQVYGEQIARAVDIDYGYDGLYDDAYDMFDDAEYSYVGLGYDGYGNQMYSPPNHGHMQTDTIKEGSLLIIIVLTGFMICVCGFVISFGMGWYVGRRTMKAKTSANNAVYVNNLDVA